jgi:hypothetical protein
MLKMRFTGKLKTPNFKQKGQKEWKCHISEAPNNIKRVQTPGSYNAHSQIANYKKRYEDLMLLELVAKNCTRIRNFPIVHLLTFRICMLLFNLDFMTSNEHDKISEETATRGDMNVFHKIW